MEILNLVQGTPEWHEHRAKSFNASEAPAMMGESPYMTRDQLLDQIVSGHTPEVTPALQKIFDDGHHFEALARPLAEKIAGDDLFPVVGVDGEYSASFDGINMDETIIFEHKTLNDKLRQAEDDPHYLPAVYRIQIEQQFMVSGAKECIFMATKWDKDDNLIEKRHWIVKPDLNLRKKIIAGWKQLREDAKTHVVKVEKPKPSTLELPDLPMVTAKVSAEVTESNIEDAKELVKNIINSAPAVDELQDDEDFVYGKNLVKFCSSVETTCDTSETNILGQAAGIYNLISAIRSIKAFARDNRLAYSKAITQREAQIKADMLKEASDAYNAHVAELDKDLDGHSLHNVLSSPNFQIAAKGKKTFKTMQAAVNELLANVKADATVEAEVLKAKLDLIKEATKGYEHLDFDVNDLLLESQNAIKSIIELQITKAKQQAEETAKAMQAEAEPEPEVTPEPEKPKAEVVQMKPADKPKAPTREGIIFLVAETYSVDYPTAKKWLQDTFGVSAA